MLTTPIGQKLAVLELRVVIALILWNFELLPLPAELSSFRVLQKITRQPQDCYLRLRPCP